MDISCMKFGRGLISNNLIFVGPVNPCFHVNTSKWLESLDAHKLPSSPFQTGCWREYCVGSGQTRACDFIGSGVKRVRVRVRRLTSPAEGKEKNDCHSIPDKVLSDQSPGVTEEGHCHLGLAPLTRSLLLSDVHLKWFVQCNTVYY
jgi:hypothetical protein